ncbi:Ferredoxin [Candidatus Xenohaliotis californiensis]|uniref:Ferredoxin n=1 Tax=Candidatus Xenohaliotis californiensis TaxID=84677 RepID=A0ABM9N8E8_9RICK|nr:Ferredoxin [Candidatus Xenohaliotis californiensis]
MSHIVLPKCIKCKYGDCVAVCPVDCFHEGKNSLAIDTEACIDCGVCVQECPINAIVQHDPANKNHNKWLAINHDAVHKYNWPNITYKPKPHPEADKYAKIKDKDNLFSFDLPDNNDH